MRNFKFTFWMMAACMWMCLVGCGNLTKTEYLTFTAEGEQFILIISKGDYTLDESLQYSVGGGKWTQVMDSTAIPFGGKHGDIRLRGKSKGGMATDVLNYSCLAFTNNDVPVACTGDIRTLVDYENYLNADTKDARFCRMFPYCTQLTSAPELPAITLADGCYNFMFEGCTSLNIAPALPATTLADFCYCGMFWGCEALTTAPVLKATTLAADCYNAMFCQCSSLTTAPELPATEMVKGCYYSMFGWCESLTTTPELPATTLANGCYSYMFHSCSSLKSITMLATDISADKCLDEWVRNVPSTGTFTKSAGMEALPSGANGIPDGWIVQVKQ